MLRHPSLIYDERYKFNWSMITQYTVAGKFELHAIPLLLLFSS